MPHTLSSDSITYNSMAGHDRMDPEVRAQIQSNIQVIYEPAVSPNVHIATCRSLDGTYMAFLVMHGNLLKTVWNPNLLAGDARQTRAAAMLSLLEATEDRIREMLLKSNGRAVKKGESKDSKQSSKKNENNAKTADSDSEHTSLDYSVKPNEKKDRGFMPWRKSATSVTSGSAYSQVG